MTQGGANYEIKKESNAPCKAGPLAELVVKVGGLEEGDEEGVEGVERNSTWL